MALSSENTSAASLLSIVAVLLKSDLFHMLFSTFFQWWNTSRFRGTYKVDEHHVTLDVIDQDGRTAIYTKRQQVTFLQNNVFAIQDQAWGDGDIFATYRCSPGVAVDRYKEGYRWKILISLRGSRNQGEREEFVIERTIHDDYDELGNRIRTIFS